jgi:hypothetical protein
VDWLPRCFSSVDESHIHFFNSGRGGAVKP